jgi:hypothetical protein
MQSDPIKQALGEARGFVNALDRLERLAKSGKLSRLDLGTFAMRFGKLMQEIATRAERIADFIQHAGKEP